MAEYILSSRLIGKTFMAKQELYTRAQKAYAEGTPIISDSEFDALEADLLGTDKVIGPEGKVKLPIRMWSMIKDSENKLIEITKEQVIVQFKIDGVALLLHYKYGSLFGAYTRGDGEYGMNVVHHFWDMNPEIPLTIADTTCDIFIIGEAYMTIESAIAKGYKNARNGIAGLLNNKEWQPGSSAIRFFAFDITYNIDTVNQAEFPTEGHKLRALRDNDFRIPPTFATFDRAMMKADGRKELPYLIDGLVVKVLNIKTQQLLGYTERAPKFYSCFKFAAESDFAVLQKIEWNVGRTGQIIPLAHFTPIDIGGSTIRKATLHSYSMVKSLNIAIGDKLKIIKAGDIIPQIDQIIERSGNECEVITQCPSCGCIIKIDGAHAKCIQPGCFSKNVEQIVYICKTLGIRGVGPVRAKELYIRFPNPNLVDCMKYIVDTYPIPIIPMWKAIQAFNHSGVGAAGAKRAVAEGKDLGHFIHEHTAYNLMIILEVIK